MVVSRMAEFLRRPKSPGLVTLNHENSAVTVGGFITSFPQIAANGWTFRSLAQVLNADGNSYQNADSSTSDVLRKGVLLNQVVSSSSTSSTVAPSPTTTANSSRSASPSSSGQNSAASFHPRTSCHLIFLLILSSVVFLS